MMDASRLVSAPTHCHGPFHSILSMPRRPPFATAYALPTGGRLGNLMKSSAGVYANIGRTVCCN